MAKKKKVPRKGTQEYLPDLGPKRNERIYAAAKIYREHMRKRVQATNKETEAHADLLTIMTDEGVDHYNDGEINIIITTGKQKCKLLEMDETKEESETEAE